MTISAGSSWGCVSVKWTYGVEIGVGELLARVALLNTGTVDENANLVAVAKYFRHQGGDALLRAQVRGIDLRLAAKLLNGVSRRGVGFVALDKQDVCSDLGEANSHGGTDTTGAASDESSVALKREEL